METRGGCGGVGSLGFGIAGPDHFESEHPFGFFDAALQVAHGAQFAQVDADRHQGLRDFRGQAGDDDAGAHQPGRVDGLHQVVRDDLVDFRDAGDVHDDDLGAVGADAAEQLFGELLGALGVQDPDDGQYQESFPDLEHGGGQIAQGVLLLPDDPFAFLDEADRDGVRDAVGGGFVGVQDAVEQREVAVVFLEQGSGQHIPEQQDDPDDLVGFHAPRDDPFGQVAGVVLEGLDAARFQDFDIVVVDGRGLGEDLLVGHRGEQVRVGDPAGPFLAQVRAVLPQVRDQFREQHVVAGLVDRHGVGCGQCPASRLYLMDLLMGWSSPFGHCPGGALADFGDDVELVHQSSGAGQPEAQASVGAHAVPHRTGDVTDPGAGVPGDDGNSAATGFVHDPYDDLPAAGEFHDVAGDLRDRGGDQGEIGGGEPGPGRDVAALLSGCHHVRVQGDQYPGLVIVALGRPAVEQGGAQLQAAVTLQQVTGGVEVSLPSAVSGGQGEQNRPAPVGGRGHPDVGEQVLHPQLGPGAVQLRGDRAGG